MFMWFGKLITISWEAVQRIAVYVCVGRVGMLDVEKIHGSLLKLAAVHLVVCIRECSISIVHLYKKYTACQNCDVQLQRRCVGRLAMRALVRKKRKEDEG